MEKWTRSLKALLIFSVLFGLIYPAIVTGVAQVLFHKKANGSLILREGTIVGSVLIGQKFEEPRYFWGRVSAVDYQGAASAAPNWGPTHAKLKERIEQRRKLFSEDSSDIAPPHDLITASASGFDPHISPEAAFFQLGRVARVRSLTKEQKEQLVDLIEGRIEDPFLFFMGEPVVNVFLLNLDVDDAFSALSSTKREK
ncbi:MAG: potassium-transporting ATPase subunit KdpC [Pseudobdellovibrionaceae bacterium]